ncbi:pitrilysin family protein [Tissierella sp.]|uniref:M16 family metallopeptidase n=1 Tax=Tissierella sp. TaxID=41274 RepID=UPI00285F2C1D|nr:pitrilysin family protein [Tissierella sp.]MDR7856219.1 pitrilysin family protein [Tissierella sp.]
MYLIDKLDNGIRVVMEDIPYVNSVSIGVIIDTGSIKEDKLNYGISHFIEHMLFKGTNKRTAKNIAESIDNIGGQLNAFTGKESTCFYAKVLYNHYDIALDVLSDMLCNSVFAEEEIEKEKSVILEEINMYLDLPEDLASETLNELMFNNTSLGHPILGTENSIKDINRDKIVEYFHTNYIPENIVISVAGKLNTKEILKELNYYFGRLNNTNKLHNQNIIINNSYSFTNKLKGIYKDTEQLNLCIGMEGVSYLSNQMEALLVLNNVVGGSMSSRLFQKIREELAIAYIIESFPSPFKDIGVFNMYVGLDSTQILKTLDYIAMEINDIKKNLITKEELAKSKEQLKGSYVLGMEGTFSRMYEIGKSLSIYNIVESPAEVLEKIEKVNIEDIYNLVNIVFNKEKVNIAYVGELPEKDSTEEKIKNILF